MYVAKINGDVDYHIEKREAVKRKEVDLININCRNNSIKPNVKVENKRKKVNKSKKALAVAACCFLVAGGVAAPKVYQVVSNNIRIEKQTNEFGDSFSEAFAIPNTHYNIEAINDYEDQVTHYHDYANIFTYSKNVTSDPIISFYLSYHSIGKNCMNDAIDTFNRIVGTDYESVDDFFLKNGFANDFELKTYVSNYLNEVLIDGNDSTRGQ
jgi:hypothetical protein